MGHALANRRSPAQHSIPIKWLPHLLYNLLGLLRDGGSPSVFILALLLPSLIPSSSALAGRVIDGFEVMKVEAEGGVSVMWGLSDAVATVGSFFHYDIPEDAFNGPVTSYEVTEVGGSTLPSWLYYNSTARSLDGVPLTEQRFNSPYHIRVTAIRTEGQAGEAATQAMDTFNIRVLPYNAYFDDMTLADTSPTPLSSDVGRPIRCSVGSPVTSVAIALDADPDQLSAVDMVNILRSMSRHLGQVSINALRFVPSTNSGSALLDSSALVAGPGDVTVPRHAGVSLEWEVGCGKVTAPHMDTLQRVEQTARDSSMSKDVGHGVIGWHVSNHKPPSSRLRKRQAVSRVQSTPTLQQTAMPPTSRHNVPTHTIEPPVRLLPTSSSLAPLPPVIVPPVEPTRSSSPTKSRAPKPSKPPTKTTAVVSTSSFGTTAQLKKHKTTTAQQPAVIQPSLATPAPSKHSSTQALPTRVVMITDSSLTPETERPSIEEEEEEKEGEEVEEGEEEEMKTEHSVIVGDSLHYRIPARAFNGLNQFVIKDVRLTFANGSDLPHNSWIKFNHAQHSLVGQPLDQHIADEQKYILSAEDSVNGKTQRIEITISVIIREEWAAAIEMGATLDLNYDKFMDDCELRLDVASKIASGFGDSDSSKLTVTHAGRGSVLLSWTNNTISAEESSDCPETVVRDVTNKFILPNGSINPSFLTAIHPYYINSANFAPKGRCFDVMKPVYVHPIPRDGQTVGHVTPDNKPDVRPKTAAAPDSHIIIPVVIIIAVIILAGVIAYLLYRKRKRDKKLAGVGGGAGDDLKGGPVKRGVPVIFANELDEARPINGKGGVGGVEGRGYNQPLLVDNNERAPLPPVYQTVATGGSNSPPSSPRSMGDVAGVGRGGGVGAVGEYREPLISGGGGGQRYPAPTGGQNNRPAMHQSSFKPSSLPSYNK